MKTSYPSEMLTTRYQITWNMKIHYHENFKTFTAVHARVCVCVYLSTRVFDFGYHRAQALKNEWKQGLAMHRNQE